MIETSTHSDMDSSSFGPTVGHFTHSDTILCICTFTHSDTEIEQVYRHPAIVGSNAGRPRFEIPRTQLTFLVESGFTGLQMAEMLGVSLYEQ